MKKFLSFLLISVCTFSFVFAQDASSDDFLSQGLQAYKDGNWDNAISLLKKANSLEETKSADVLYMLIMAEMFKGEYSDVLNDAAVFEATYPVSVYGNYVEYQKGRAYYYLNDYKTAMDVFAKFCNENEDDEMFPSSLFWMGECLYQTYHFEEARGIFERVVNYYPDSAKYTEALYRLDLITQREKEEKLLYLLKVTGEEFLASKTEFERELRQYKTSESIDLRTQLEYAQQELKEKDRAIAIAKEENEKLKEQNKQLKKQLDDMVIENAVQRNNYNREEIERLKKKAIKVQTIIEDEENKSE